MRSIKVYLLVLLLAAPCLSKEKYTIGVLSDLQSDECQPKYPTNSLRAIQLLTKNHSFEKTLFSGDVVHGECLKKVKHYGIVTKAMWQEFDKNFFKPARAFGPVAMAPGNHDAPFAPYYPSAKKNIELEHQAFKEFWNSKKGSLGVEPIHLATASHKYPYYYSYLYKKDLFIILQSTKNSKLTDRKNQISWLKDLLESDYRNSARNVIAVMHIPPYPVLNAAEKKRNSIVKDEQVGKSTSNPLVDLLLDNRVDVLITGHSHAPYPGKLTRIKDSQSLFILSMPCTHSPRRLHKVAQRSFRGFAKIVVEDTIRIGIYSIEQPYEKEGELIPLDYFPGTLGLNSKIIRYERIDNSSYLK